MIQVLIFGASGYSGAQLVQLVCAHPHMQLAQAYNSANSVTAKFSDLHPGIAGNVPEVANVSLLPATPEALNDLPEADVAFLALPHEASAGLAPMLLESGLRVFDLSGAYRLKNREQFDRFYGFQHTSFERVATAFYCLMDWQKPTENEWLCSIPGCYPTAASLALLPVINPGMNSNQSTSAAGPLVSHNSVPVVHAVSGVTGAGRKASLAMSFAELSYMAYGVAGHRHTPEIEQNLQRSVQFTPHIAPFKRGLMATCTLKLADGFPDAELAERVSQAFVQAYSNNPSIRLRETPPRIDDVAGTGLCDIHWQVRDGYLVSVAAIDNLLKGAASQALQAANVVLGFNEYMGVPGVESAYV